MGMGFWWWMCGVYKGGLCKWFIKMYPYTIFYTFEHTLFGSQYTVHKTMRFRGWRRI